MNKKNKKIITFFIHKIFTELSTTYSIEFIGKIRVLHIFHNFFNNKPKKVINIGVESVKIKYRIDKITILLL